tara:strand:+ start:23 stop:790 length:768 start_codon:yes stop_codon:yes gene_type:complete
MLLKDKLAVITGAGSGIGEATAKLFATEGAKVVLVARTQASLEKVVNEIVEMGGYACAYSLDVCVTASVEETFKAIEADFGPVDILINSAGVFYPTPGGEMIEKQWRGMLDVNVGGTVNTCNAVLPGMKARESGHIVNIASISGLVAGSNYSVYGASKAAVITLSKSLAAEFAPYGIHINIIAPGNTSTPMNNDIRTQPEHAEMMKNIDATTPSKRNFSEPIDIARSALFLVSDAAAPYYGAVLVADEGQSLEIE